MSIKNLFLFLSILFCVSSCNKASKSDGSLEVKNKDVRKTYFSNGVLHREIIYKGGVKNGLSKEFYNNGQLFEEVPYKNNLREGLARRFYDSGVLCQETPYEKNKIHGIKKRYRRSGQLMCEVPFHEGKECIGLKEYAIDDALKVHYPTIVISPIDNILKNGKYTLLISLSDKSKAVDYYLGELVAGKYVDEFSILPKKNGIGEIEYQLSRGEFRMEELTIVAKVKTAQSNYYITRATFHLAIENRF